MLYGVLVSLHNIRSKCGDLDPTRRQNAWRVDKQQRMPHLLLRRPGSEYDPVSACVLHRTTGAAGVQEEVRSPGSGHRIHGENTIIEAPSLEAAVNVLLC